MKKVLRFRVAASAVCVLCAMTARVAAAQTFTTLLSFDGSDGAGPYYMSLVQDTDDNFYGTTSSGGAYGNGVVFTITPEGALTVLYSFCAQPNCSDGSEPSAGLALGQDGNLYGTTYSGGANGWGTAFKISPAGALTTLYSFCARPNCTDGVSPYAGLLQASDGNFYGTTTGGGSTGHGTVFRLTSEGKLTRLHSFCAKLGNCTDGSSPQGTLVQASDGSLYGTTSEGGRSSGGTIFRMLVGGALQTIARFGGGGNPSDGLTEGSDGNFYGTTYFGGHRGDGTVFKVTPQGILTTLHAFCGGACSDGSYPAAPLVLANDGNFYGTTTRGGDLTCNALNGGCGTIFQITTQGTFTTVHIFEGADGYDPFGGLLQANNGLLYGATTAGGSSNAGTIFSLSVNNERAAY